MRARAIALLAAAALAVGACGGSEDDTDLPAAVPANPAETTSTETMTAPATTTTTTAGSAKSAISTDLSSKPTIPKPSGEAPTKLVVKDIVKGKGAAAKLDDTVTVHYVGSVFSSGEEFEASWDSGETAQFPLSKGQLIAGWVEGIPGMKVGGRRMLVIPSELAYGASGSPPSIGPDETLVFVIDLKKVD